VSARLGVFGGTFDPVHNAHLAMAAAALAHLRLARVLWIPTGVPPYRQAPVAPSAHRLAMLRLAIAGEPRYQIDPRELAPGASGYTVDTLVSLRRELPAETLLYLLMGADQYEKLSTWKAPDEIRRLARLAVAARPGWSAPGDAQAVPMAPMDVSASDIRGRAARGQSIAGLVPGAVEDYIFRNRLYA
jgi:nicotinate-nucleotide adenylyltransferase